MYMNKPTLLLAIALAIAPLAMAAEAAVLSREPGILIQNPAPMTQFGGQTGSASTAIAAPAGTAAGAQIKS